MKKLSGGKGRLILYILLSLIPIFNIITRLPDSKFSGDTASLILPALSGINGIGAPYSDYWEYKPPGIMIIVNMWAMIFGQSLGSFKIFHLLINILISLIIYQLSSKVLSRRFSQISTLIISVIVFSPNIESLLIGSEMLGLLFSLLGLKLLIQNKPNIFWAGFAFATSSQIKDPFGFAAIAFFPFVILALKNADFKSIFAQLAQYLVGFTSSLAVITAYLLSINALPSYLEVLKYKSGFFNLKQLIIHTPDTIALISKLITEFNYSHIIIMILSIGAFISLIKLININRANFSQLVVVYYSIGSFVGFAAGRSISSHYLVQIIPPLILTIAIFIEWIEANTIPVLKRYFSQTIAKTLYLLIFVVVLFPNNKLALAYIPEEFLVDVVWHVQLNPEEEYILEHTTTSDCIISVYGWGASEAPVHTKRRTCTRHFLANITLAKWQQLEYYTQVVNNPPKVVIYNTVDTDMNYQEFERTVFNWPAVLRECYSQSSQISRAHLLNPGSYLDHKQCLENYAKK